MRMWTLIPALFMTAALAAGCGEQTPRPKTAGSSTPTASAGAGGAGPAAPKSESESLPGSQAAATGAETKPDPGDANDHSNPQHDARNKKDRD